MNHHAHTARCACGDLRLEVDGPLPPASWCHCDQCRRRTGSVFGAQFRVDAARTRPMGRSRTWTRVGDAGARITFHRCETCGSTVWWEISVFPNQRSVAAGAFGRDLPPPPRVTVYDERRPGWLCLPESVETVIG